LRILFLSHRVPYPPNKGDKIRSFNELKHFSRHYEVDLLSFCDNPEEISHAEALRKFCRNVILIPLNRRFQQVRALRSMLQGKPWTLGYFSSPEMRAAVHEFLSAGRQDAVFVFSSSMAPYVASAAQIPKVLDFVDSDASKWLQYAQFKPLPASWVFAYEGKRLADFERQMVQAFDASVFVSARDATQLLNPEHRQKIHVVQNGIDLEYFSLSKPAEASSIIIFTGAMDYFPNVDAVTFFAGSVFPLVRSRCPDAEFHIVGSRPAPGVRRLGDLPGVTVTGTVPDIRPFLAKSKVAVIPMRISQGIQNKILEAMAAGLPVVTTPAAAAGFASIGEMPLAVAASAEDFAGHVVQFLREPLPLIRAQACRDYLGRHYNWDTNLSMLDELLNLAVAARQRTA
jgi:sugar transferase (PEP-CTERM/EpsH1 system associated)